MAQGTLVPHQPMPARPSHMWLRLQRAMRLFSGCCHSCQELPQTLPIPVVISAPFIFLAVLSFPSTVFFL